MYIVWKRRRLRKTEAGTPARYRPTTHCPHATAEERYALTPHVVRSRRVNGRPRQDTVLILPAFRSCCVRDSAMQARWWHAVDGRIDWLGRALNADDPHFIDATTAAQLRAELRRVVPLPPPDVLAAHVAAEKGREAREREKMKRFAESVGDFFVSAGRTATARVLPPCVAGADRPLRGGSERPTAARVSIPGVSRMALPDTTQQTEFARSPDLMEQLERLAEECSESIGRCQKLRRGLRAQGPAHLQEHLAVLGLKWPCTLTELTRAYFATCLKLDPNVPGYEEDLRRVQGAHQAIGEELARAAA